MTDWLQDTRYALRMLRRSPGFAAVAIAALALGIGANVSLFTVVRGVLLRPLPYDHPDRLVEVFTANPAKPAQHSPFSPQDLDDFRRQQDVFSSVGAFWYSAASSGKTLTGQGEPLHLETAFADSSFFQTLALSPSRGRAFLASEEVHGNDAVVLLSDHLWRSQFAADPDIVGKKISLDGSPFVVVGVMPRSFVFPARQVDLWLPLAQITNKEIPHIRSLRWIETVARLKPGVTMAQAASASSVIMKRLADQYPESNFDQSGGAEVVGLRQTIVGDVRPVLLALFAAVALVLLMACANLANLLLARGASRTREFAIRAALGADRGRLRRQALTESLVLTLLGGAAAFVIATWITSALLALSADSIPRPGEIHLDFAVVAFGVALSLATGLLIGAIPAMKLAAARMWDSLKAIGAATTGDVQHQRGRDLLIVAEVALACVLLVASSLVLKSLWKLTNTDAGFDATHVLTVELGLPMYKFSDPKTQRGPYVDELLRRVAAVPGVTVAGASKTLPLYGGGEPFGFKVTNSRGQQQEVTPTAGAFIVTQGYFEALKIPLVAGRTFTQADLAEKRMVVVLSHNLAQSLWPGENPVGKFVDFSKTARVQVIGVVGDVRSEGLNKPSGTAMYVPSSLAPRQKLDLFVRTAGDPLSVAGAVRQAIQQFEPDQAISNIAPLQQAVQETVAQPRFFSTVLTAFGAVALLLAALGIFGVISYNVRQRTREIGIRMALGASRGDVLAMVLAKAATLLAIGAAVGMAAALGAGRLLSGLLYGVGAADPQALLASVAILAAVAVSAAMIPALRATHVDPMVALRYE
ncbi:MAG TPA: ABC transporter permease [Terriglobales bacterium]|nr:ABC transporter permease [Terriglobales bacterium]